MARSYDSWLQDYDGWLDEQPKAEYHIKEIEDDGVIQFLVYNGCIVEEAFNTEEDAENFIKYLRGE